MNRTVSMQEIDRISQMEEEEPINPYEEELARWIAQDLNMQRILDDPITVPERNYAAEPVRPVNPLRPYPIIPPEPETVAPPKQQEEQISFQPNPKEETREEQRKEFALTPFDKGYYDRYNVKSRNRRKYKSSSYLYLCVRSLIIVC